MPRHCENAQKVAEFLQQHENVSWVQYCGLPGDKYYELGQKYLPHGSCGVVSFGVRADGPQPRLSWDGSRSRPSKRM